MARQPKIGSIWSVKEGRLASLRNQILNIILNEVISFRTKRLKMTKDVRPTVIKVLTISTQAMDKMADPYKNINHFSNDHLPMENRNDLYCW